MAKFYHIVAFVLFAFFLLLTILQPGGHCTSIQSPTNTENRQEITTNKPTASGGSLRHVPSKIAHRWGASLSWAFAKVHSKIVSLTGTNLTEKFHTTINSPGRTWRYLRAEREDEKEKYKGASGSRTTINSPPWPAIAHDEEEEEDDAYDPFPVETLVTVPAPAQRTAQTASKAGMSVAEVPLLALKLEGLARGFERGYERLPAAATPEPLQKWNPWWLRSKKWATNLVASIIIGILSLLALLGYRVWSCMTGLDFSTTSRLVVFAVIFVYVVNLLVWVYSTAEWVCESVLTSFRRLFW
ncbi:MAG: hypothetical protein LQ346_003153 [Caloplaca aetnensis]|nr:MAG: hypothetical protein LQ346_003153 [Caloplaca aetnensis]